jgi:hypothetical protein
LIAAAHVDVAHAVVCMFILFVVLVCTIAFIARSE